VLSDSASTLPQLLILAVVQGVSEFLPISSDGHLVLTQTWLGFEGPHLAVDVALHLGTLMAVLVVFRRDLLKLLADVRRREWGEIGLLALGTLPAAVIGLTLQDLFERLFESGRAAAVGLLVTAAFLAVGERARRRGAATGEGSPDRPLTWRDALWIGAMQSLAILPGVSRSGTTIATALVRGVSGTSAARYSFLLSIPAVAGAVVLKVPELAASDQLGLDLGIAIGAAFLVGVLALRFLLAFLGRGAFLWCALYITALALFALALGV
jgi:undecaprenyl-diphosphatase